MPFKAVKLTLRERIAQARERLEVAKETRPPIDLAPILNTVDIPRQEIPIQPRIFEPTFFNFQGIPQEPLPVMEISELPQPTRQPFYAPREVVKEPEKVTIKPEEPRADVPFWQRALQVFTAPFEWVDENIIKPGLGLAGTALGIEEVQRLPGEDFWEWKKRSWEGWDAPGINMPVPWSEEPWRVDVKGVLEFAPWLLIPGAGQVGAGVRAGVGIAGALGRAGKVGRALGRAVEFSPWGLVEKTAGVALKGAVRGVSRATAGVSARIGERLVGKIPEPVIPPHVQDFTRVMNDVIIPQEKAFLKELPSLRQRQAAFAEDIARQVREGKLDPLEATARKEGLAGGVKEQFAIETGLLPEETVRFLVRDIYVATEKGLVSMDTAGALQKMMLETGELLAPRHFKELANVFGGDFSKAIQGLSSMKQSTFQKVIDFLNFPRAVLASTDLSATARQGLFLGLLHPTQVPKWFGRQLKAFYSEKISLEMESTMRSHPNFSRWVNDMGVDFTDLRKGAETIAREEPFFSSAARIFPFVRRSERAFTTYLNQARMTAADGAYNAMVAQGASPAQLKSMGKFINLAAGRGKLPANLDQYAPIFNTVLFSPKLQAATLQLPRQIGRMLLSRNPYERKEAAKALLTFVGGGAALIGLLNARESGSVELDPRSGDFAKIKIGDTRLDIWRGYVQYIRFVAQSLTGERKSAYGNMNKVGRDEIAWRFLHSPQQLPCSHLVQPLLEQRQHSSTSRVYLKNPYP